MNGDTWELWADGKMLAWMCERPSYCNRGRYHANIEAPVIISDADPWPRYYFTLVFGMFEVADWLQAHGVHMTGSDWKLNPAPPGTIDMAELVSGRLSTTQEHPHA